MPHPLEAGTIRIFRPNGSTAGTGFLVSKRLAVTCAHVVTSAKAKPGDMISFKYHLGDLDAQTAKVLENGWSTENDVAILEFTENLPKWIRPLIMQSSRAMEGRAFQGLGYPNDGPVQARWVQGNIGGLVQVDQYSNQLLQIQGTEIDVGLSGSAIVDHATRKVVGMLTAYHDLKRPAIAPQVRFAYSIPVETIWEVYPDIKNELPAYHSRSPLTEGIHLLPYDYANRIQNFLAEYLGTPEQPEPFGGRDDALKKLDNWLEGNTQRLLLAAPAGRGKSALLVRWLDRLIVRDEIALVFVPISVRFNTNLASTFFASLGARLAYLHDGEVPTDETTSTGIWRGLTSAYLTKPLNDERKLLVVLDGLDEADDWEATADLIPAELPSNVRVVVSARFVAGDSDAQPWLSRLGWEHNGKASSLELSPLDSSGVADVLLCMGVPLDILSRRVDIVTELHRLSEGDPLLVNLYVEDLWSRGEEASRFATEDLQSIKPGYEGYFDRWWTDQKKLWGKEAPLREKDIRFIFNLLCNAMGGLTKDDLIALDTEGDLNSYTIEDALDILKRFVIGVPDERREKEIGYVFSHPKLRNYFWEKLSKREQTEIENCFNAWGERIMRALIAKEIKPADVSRYLLHYYSAHLERSDVSMEKYLPFIDYPYWHQAWFDYENSYNGYLHIVDLSWRQIVEHNISEIKGAKKTAYLDKEIRCALIKSSMASQSENMPSELPAHLVANNIWTPAQALVYIRQIPDKTKQALALEKLIPNLPEEYVADCINWVLELPYEDMRAVVLSQLIEFVPLAKIDDILLSVYKMKSPFNRVRLLARAANRLPKQQSKNLFEDVLKTADNIEAQLDCAKLLSEIVPFMAGEMQIVTIKKVFTLLAKTDESSKSNQVFCNIAKYVPDNFLLDALSFIESNRDLVLRSKAIATISERLAPEIKNKLVVILIFDALNLEDKNKCTKILIEVWKGMSEDLAVYVIAKVGESNLTEDKKLLLLGSFAKHFNNLQAADDFVGESRINPDKTFSVGSHAVALQKTELNDRQNLQTKREEAKFLTTLAQNSVGERKIQILNDALIASKGIEDNRYLGFMLSKLVPHLSKEFFDEALVIMRQTLDKHVLVEGLIAFAIRESGEKRVNLIKEALKINYLSAELIKQIPSDLINIVLSSVSHYSVYNAWGHIDDIVVVETISEKLLGSLIERLPENLIDAALEKANKVSGSGRVLLVASIYRRKAEITRKSDDINIAIASAQEINDQKLRIKALTPLVTLLPQEQQRKMFEDLLNKTQKMPERDASDLLYDLKKHMSSDLASGLDAVLVNNFDELLSIDPLNRYYLLNEMMFKFVKGKRKDFLSDISKIMPVIISLGDDEFANNAYIALLDVIDWWP